MLIFILVSYMNDRVASGYLYAIVCDGRIVGWCAHRNEELNFEGKRIIRPAYRCVVDSGVYVPLKDR